MSQSVVVGYDGSGASLLALEWAVTAAAQREFSLNIVTTWVLPSTALGMGMGTAPGPSLEDQAEHEARKMLDTALARAKELDPTGGTLQVSGEVIPGAPAKTLIELSPQAALLVVGTHGTHGLAGALLGSVSRQVMTHAKCPVVVIRKPASATSQDVVVGVDGSPPSKAALEFAFDHASRAGMGVRVLHTWELPTVLSPTTHPSFSEEEIQREFAGSAARETAELVAACTDRWPDVTVTQEVAEGMAGRKLVEASRDAALVVVGSRGHGGFVGLMIGSVSHYVGHHADCPVAVVH